MTTNTHLITTGEFIDIRDWTVFFDGTTNNGAALRNAIAQCPDGGTIYIPPVGDGFLTDMATISGKTVHFEGRNSKVISTWSAESQAAGLISNTYKASPALLFKPSADYSSVRGIRFEQDGTFPSTYNSPAGYISASTLAPLIFQGCDEVTVTDCTFANVATGRGVFFRGGSGQVVHCTFLASSAQAHLGEVSSTLFWDATTDTSTRYSPFVLITANTFDGSNTTSLARNSVFLTGCRSSVVSSNVFSNMTVDGSGFNIPIEIYANDLGTYSESGTNISYQRIQVANNLIEGTFESAIYFNGNPVTSGLDTDPNGAISGNTIRGTGHGVFIEHGSTIKVADNVVITSGSPLKMADHLSSPHIHDNHLECTSTGQSSVTLWTGSTLSATDINFHDNCVVMGPSDIYAWNNDNTTDISGRFTNNTWVLASSTADASRRPVQIQDAVQNLHFEGNVFDVRNSTWSGRIMASITNSTAATINVSRNTTVSTNGTSFTSRGMSISSATNVVATGNDFGTMDITATGDVFLTANRFTSATSTVPALTVTGAARVKMVGSHAELTTTNNAAVAKFDSCAKTILTGNTYKAASSSVAVVQATTSGQLIGWMNLTENGGAGAATSTSGTATIAEWVSYV